MNSRIKKTIGAVTAGALIFGTGVGIYEYFDEEEQIGIDWSVYELNVPAIEVPKLNVPKLNAPKIEIASIDMPKLDETENISNELNEVSINVPKLDDIKIIGLDVPSLNEIILENLSINVSMISEPSLKVMLLDSPILKYVILDSFDLNIDDTAIKNLLLDETLIEIPKIGYSQLEQPQIDRPDNDFDEWVAFSKEVNSTFEDDRMIKNDETIKYSNKNMHKWLNIYKEYKNYEPVEYVKIAASFKMITEVFIPKSADELNMIDENLTYYKNEGYDSVLVTFDLNSNPDDVLNTVKYIIKHHNMKVWLAYSGDETLKTTVFCDPDILAKTLKITAPYLSGYLNSWRRTSAHLWKQDVAFMNFVNHTLRSSNPNLPIVGELFYGTSYLSKNDSIGIITNMFSNASGVMFMNFGYYNINVKKVMTDVLQKMMPNVDKIACVLGSNAYYLTERKNGLSYQTNMKIKHSIEERYLENGCIGTITFSDDGRYQKTNNLSKTLYSTLNGK